MEEFYKMFGINEDSTLEEIEVAYNAYKTALKARYDNGDLSDAEYLDEFQKAYDAYIGVRTYRESRDKEAEEIARENNGEVPDNSKAKKVIKNLVIYGAVAAILAVGYVHTKNYGWKLGHQAGYDEGVNRDGKGTYITATVTEEPKTDEEVIRNLVSPSPAPVVVVTEEPKVTEAPKAEATPKATKKPKKEAKVTEAPKEEVKVTEEPKVEVTPEATRIIQEKSPSESLFGESETTPEVTEAPKVTETPKPTEVPTEVPTEAPTEVPTVVPTEAPTAEPTPKVEFVKAVNYGDIMDDQLVMARATKLANEMYDAGAISMYTGAPYTPEELFVLIKFANGVYTPDSIEEVDLLYYQLIDLLQTTANIPHNVAHVNYAAGDNNLLGELRPDAPTAVFSEAFAAYGTNGVYPLVRWFEEKRIAIFRSTDREEIDRIYSEVGQVMADIMKGNGCTIVVDGVEQTFTSEQILAQPSSAFIIIQEAQIIFLNHHEERKGNEVVVKVNEVWDVYNRYNTSGVDENGKPIIEPDRVTLDEIQYWINSTCTDEELQAAYQAIDEELDHRGYTFSQVLQMKIEKLAFNLYYVNHGQTLTKTK